MIEIKGLTKSFGNKIVLNDLNLTIPSHTIFGLVGINGAGKSTLLYLMSGLLTPKSGKVVYHDVDVRRRLPITLQDMFLVPEEFDLPPVSLISYIELNSPFYPRFSKEDMVKYLHYFEMDINIDLGALSMGQKKKVFMSFALATNTSLLLMDEPTNHLDMETREALTVALSSYEGAVLLVSHDRHLLRASCDELWLVRDGKLSEFDGDLDEYAEIVLKDKKARNAAPEDSGAPAPVNRKEQRRNEAQERARISALSKPLKKELSKIEKELDLANKEKSALDLKLADTDFYQGNQEEVAEALKRHGELSSKIDELEGRWLEISEELQNISSSSDLS